MRIESNDTFALSWVTSYETPFKFEAQVTVECYESTVREGSGPIIVTMTNLKSRAEIQVKCGETWIKRSRWQMVVLQGEDVMLDFVRHIMKNSMSMSEEEADMVVDRVYETLQDGLNNSDSDPRLN